MESTRIETTPVGIASSSNCKISWSAIFSGAFIGMGLAFLLQLFGIASGLSAYHSTSAGATTMAIGGFLGLLVGSIVSMATAGYVAGYLGRYHYAHCHGVIYGFLTWSIALLLTALLAMPLTRYISTYNKMLAPSVVVSDSMPQNIEVTSQRKVDGQAMATNQPLVKVAPEMLTGSAWLIFLLFFIGAISSCIGACYGMNSKREEFNEVRSQSRRRDVEF